MDIKIYIYIASGVMVTLFLFAFGRFLWRVPSLIDTSIFKDIGKFMYRIMCKSGFIVIIIIFITYYICMNSPSLNKLNDNPDHSNLNAKKERANEKAN